MARNEREQGAAAGADEATVVVGRPGAATATTPPGQAAGPAYAAHTTHVTDATAAPARASQAPATPGPLPAIGLGALAGLLLFAVTAGLLLALR